MSEQHPERPDPGASSTPPGATPPPAGQHGQQPYGQPSAGQTPYGQQQPPYYAPQAPGFSTAGQPADLGIRFVARLVDNILLSIVSGIIGSIFGASALTSVLTTGRVDYGTVALVTVVTTAITVGYFVLLESSRGQTLGKMLMKVRTVGPGGGNPTPAEALKRNLWTALSILSIIPVLGWVGGLLSLVAAITIAVTISSNTATRQGWHDTFAGGTSVVRVG